MKRQGFTFIELLVALSLFMVGMISVLQIFPINRRFLLQSAMQTQAVFLAQERMEQLRALPYSGLVVGSTTAIPTSTDTFSQFSVVTQISYIDGNRAVTGTDVGLKKLTVSVSWNEKSVSRTYTLVTYDYDK